MLKEVWEVHNNKQQVLMELGQLGSVSGDCFVKVAYEPPYVDAAGVPQEGKIRILPINPAFCFPEFHPHDRSRMIRFKTKYKFWGTAQDGTRQVMTYVELMTEDMIEEYINDELIDSAPNPIGEIAVAFCPNIPVASSPWGLADITDIVSLNREYNEKATEISDIINYHACSGHCDNRGQGVQPGEGSTQGVGRHQQGRQDPAAGVADQLHRPARLHGTAQAGDARADRRTGAGPGHDAADHQHHQAWRWPSSTSR